MSIRDEVRASAAAHRDLGPGYDTAVAEGLVERIGGVPITSPDKALELYVRLPQLRDAEIERLFRKCPELSERERDAIGALADRLLGKFMHPYLSTLRRQADRAVSAEASVKG